MQTFSLLTQKKQLTITGKELIAVSLKIIVSENMKVIYMNAMVLFLIMKVLFFCSVCYYMKTIMTFSGQYCKSDPQPFGHQSPVPWKKIFSTDQSGRGFASCLHPMNVTSLVCTDWLIACRRLMLVYGSGIEDPCSRTYLTSLYSLQHQIPCSSPYLASEVETTSFG